MERKRFIATILLSALAVPAAALAQWDRDRDRRNDDWDRGGWNDDYYGNDNWGNSRGKGNGKGKGNRNGNDYGYGNGYVPNVRVDTAGRGTFQARGVNARITRGWVDTRNNVAVALSGDRNFGVTFYGTINRSSNDRAFTMRITSSNRGNAQGTAQVRLNNDRNEVEWISVDGRMNGDRFQGSFNR
jgi:hypothetical protein